MVVGLQSIARTLLIAGSMSRKQHMEVMKMALESISSVSSSNVTATQAASQSKAASTQKTTENDKAVENLTEQAGAVFEKSKTDKASSNSHIYNADLVNKLKADAEAQTENLRNIVQNLMLGQSSAFSKANGDDMWKFLAKGDFTVDAATKAQAEKDIAEDGYWGVNQVSDRILDFAKALAGDDVKYAEKLKSAFEKGFKEATKAWGQDLPSLSQDTYAATQKKFDEWINSANTEKTAAETAATVTEKTN